MQTQHLKARTASSVFTSILYALIKTWVSQFSSVPVTVAEANTLKFLLTETEEKSEKKTAHGHSYFNIHVPFWYQCHSSS